MRFSRARAGSPAELFGRPMIERFGHLPASSLIIDRLDDGHRWVVRCNYIDRATASGRRSWKRLMRS
jgi:hypothetical protein